MKDSADAVAIALGGAAGAIARVALSTLVPIGHGVPWATLIANVLGSLLLGVVAALPTAQAGFARVRMPLIGIGFCGGLTTFSALSWELFDLLERGSPGIAIAYAAISLVLGIVAVLVGRRIAAAPASDRARHP